MEPGERAAQHARVAVIGAGFAGLGVAIRLKQAGIPFVVFERADEIGGTWRDNTYPGCQCDVPSHLYSFSFALNPNWSRTYSPQSEIWQYLRDCASRFDLYPEIRFGHEVVDAAWDQDDRLWRIETAKGRWTAEVLISGNGGLAEPAIPHLPGLDSFAGTSFHSAAWDHEHDLTDRKVAVVGTGASAIQLIPKIQPLVERLHVFQRTPGWVLPHTDRPTTGHERAAYRRFPPLQRLVRGLVYMAREMLVFGLTRNIRLLKPLNRIGKAHLRRQVRDRELRKKLIPRFSPGCKRLLLSNDYYPALTQPNVDVITEGITEVRPTSIVTTDGAEHEVDTIIFATGFLVTDNPMMERLRGADGRSLAKVWLEGGLRAYLGTTVDGFPNLFLMTGPNTGIGHTSVLVMIEAQIRYVIDCLETMSRRGLASVEVKEEAVARFSADVHERSKSTVWMAGGCASWYLDAAGRNTTLWPDFTWRFRLLTRHFDPENYILTPAGSPPSA